MSWRVNGPMTRGGNRSPIRTSSYRIAAAIALAPIQARSSRFGWKLDQHTARNRRLLSALVEIVAFHDGELHSATAPAFPLMNIGDALGPGQDVTDEYRLEQFEFLLTVHA